MHRYGVRYRATLSPTGSTDGVVKSFFAKQEEMANAPEMYGDYTLEEFECRVLDVVQT